MTLFSAKHDDFRVRAREFVEVRLAPHADEWERLGAFPTTIFAELATEGLLGMTQAPQYGGQALDFGFDIVLAEELPRCRMGGLTLSVLAQNNFFLPLLAKLGTGEQKEQFLTPAARGIKIGALASTEPGGGSDIINATQSTARSDGDFWIINGEKKYITNGPIADFIVTLVRTTGERNTNSFSLIIIPSDTPGFTVKETLRKHGLNTSPTGWLEFKDCRVPKAFTLGKPNLGYFYHTQNLLQERLIGGASSVALAALALDDTIDYLRKRVAYNRPLSALQTIRHRVSEMAAEIEMARRFVHSVCESFRDGKVEAREICMIKFQVIDIVQRVVDRCMQLHGAAGFMEENWIGRAYRDVRVLSLGGGTSEVMKDLVASYLRLG